jgi:hypothetical protein
MKIPRLAIHVLSASSLFIVSAQADTVGYWRFEDSPGFLNDSSGNNRTLSTALTSGSTDAPAQYTLPESGAGSQFPDSIPQTNQPNLKAALFADGTDANAYGDGYFSTPDFINFNQASVAGFSIEAYINANSFVAANDSVIAAHWGSQKSWAFNVNQDTAQTVNGLSMWLHNATSGGGVNNQFTSTALTISVGVDYYVAAVFKRASADGIADGSITFYLRDLTNNGDLLTDTLVHSRRTIPDSSSVFTIGNIGTGQVERNWNGIIDEVRLSNSILTPSELLAIPEPSTFGMILAGFGLLVSMQRFRRVRKA